MGYPMIRKGTSPMRYIFLLLLVITAPLPLLAAGKESSGPEERFFIVKNYRFSGATDQNAQDVGQSLCSVRCNALSLDYLNVTEPGGWRLIKVAVDRELTVPLRNPFMEGQCICIADEYILKLDELNRPR
jgi:hypothetical protein